ncbi:hypothetical protein EJ07DRAFT_166702 [Lizonia empirigonia]|nr:hypothetical protein EJ07DRAFT_166702 [Lizonia empirigonia]
MCTVCPRTPSAQGNIPFVKMCQLLHLGSRLTHLLHLWGSARVGNIEIHELSRVTEIDSGQITAQSIRHNISNGISSVYFSHISIKVIESQLAIVVPCMNQEQHVHGSSMGFHVSNSDFDNFTAERKTMSHFCIATQRQGIVVLQRDAGLARAFYEADMPHTIEDKPRWQQKNSAGRIRNGKGEAMRVGTFLAKLAGKRFLGFIDAENFVPGAVHEYCKWKSKPKIIDGKLVPEESGRCSRIVNVWMDRLLTYLSASSTDGSLIRTANASKHAMSTDLALQLNFATGYAVEPFHFINVWERSRILPPSPPPTPPRFTSTKRATTMQEPLSHKLKNLQVETLNSPGHIHDFSKGEEHILRMQAQGLSTIYHGRLAPQDLKNELRAVPGFTVCPAEHHMPNLKMRLYNATQ